MNLKHYFSLHTESAKSAAAQFIRQPFGMFLILIMLSIAMTLPLSLYLGVQSAQALIGKMKEAPQITLYMELSADTGDNEEVRKLLSQDKRIEKYEFVGKQQGLDELQKSMGGQDLVSMLDENPLPDVFIVTPQGHPAPEQMKALQNDLNQFPMVESAQLDAEWMQTLYQVNDFIRKIFYFLAVTLSLAFVLVAHNTIRLQILSRKEEIEITKLLGAPSSFIRRPFLYQAAWQSLLAAGVSLVLCAWLMASSRPLVNQIFKPYGVNIEWRFFTFSEILLVLLVVTALGMGGAWLATQQHLLGFKAKKS
ncbi:permease-like cell division protein FtsX [Neisseria wadsworthii]|uniref:Cell division protein FtsX n=1 Tax=Neisseria wadsworthii 9715 TaxID=1030841 RepID=G4CQ09_9NEIS|nr:permease-like cell division protein FtsX [Neisseria wadsworthii]EGZ47129.1 cell division protein FtsX [Neisseria wadsworthii 9715]QMT34945.1 FtsX-like permease family protein [Neisseria wadsworthii]